MRFGLFILVIGLLAGCASGPGYDEQVQQSYRPGMTRTEAHTLLAHAILRSSVSRPAEGWSATDNSNDQASRAAFQCERTHPEATVRSCEVYWVGRHTSAPLVAGGVWFDYLYFDGDDRLIDYHRRFLD
jgi:hypothetical protein